MRYKNKISISIVVFAVTAVCLSGCTQYSGAKNMAKVEEAVETLPMETIDVEKYKDQELSLANYLPDSYYCDEDERDFFSANNKKKEEDYHIKITDAYVTDDYTNGGEYFTKKGDWVQENLDFLKRSHTEAELNKLRYYFITFELTNLADTMESFCILDVQLVERVPDDRYVADFGVGSSYTTYWLGECRYVTDKTPDPDSKGKSYYLNEIKQGETLTFTCMYMDILDYQNHDLYLRLSSVYPGREDPKTGIVMPDSNSPVRFLKVNNLQER